MNSLNNLQTVPNTYNKNEVKQVEKNSKAIPVSYKLFDPFKYQSFFKNGNVEEIEKSIQKIGLLDPLIVVKNDERYEILSGHTRYDALVKIIESNNFKGYKFHGKTYFDEIPVYILKEIDEAIKLSIFYDSNVTQRELSRAEKKELAKKWAKLVLNEEVGFKVTNKKKFVAEKANISTRTAQTIINEVQGKNEELGEMDIFVKKLETSSRIIRNQKFKTTLTDNDKRKLRIGLSELEQEIKDIKQKFQV